jgi:type I restriction enzyme M protein
MVALPGQLFYSTQIPVCLWFLTKSKGARTLLSASGEKQFIRARKGETLFIDARKMGTLIDRVHRELTKGDLEKIVSTYHDWKHDVEAMLKDGKARGLVYELPPGYLDIPGFCKSATTAEIAAHGHVLTPGRYVGAEEVEDDGEPFEEKMPRLVAELNQQFTESAKLEAAIRANLKGLGYAL